MQLHWGKAIATVYTVFALGTIGFVTFAMGQPVELVSDRYYEQALVYDERIEARASVEALGAAFTCRVTADGRTLVLRVPAEARGAGTITFYRPSGAARDRVEPIALDANGEQRLPLADVGSGHWRVQVAWEAGGRAYYYEQPLEIR